jgi:hypothetical protein
MAVSAASQMTVDTSHCRTKTKRSMIAHAVRARARLLARVYEVDPTVCPKCGAVGAALSRELALHRRFAVAPRDNFSYYSR